MITQSQRDSNNVIPMVSRIDSEPDSERDSERASLLAISGGARARVHALARTREATMRELRRYYCDTYGRSSCPPVVTRAMEDALYRGMDAEIIKLAMDAAADAARPSWAYAEAIVTRCLSEGVLDVEAYHARSARHKRASNPAQQYEQRPARGDDYYERLFVRLDEQ